jgi:NAD dependent epimerase/dehydratase family enzyme
MVPLQINLSKKSEESLFFSFTSLVKKADSLVKLFSKNIFDRALKKCRKTKAVRSRTRQTYNVQDNDK